MRLLQFYDELWRLYSVRPLSLIHGLMQRVSVFITAAHFYTAGGCGVVLKLLDNEFPSLLDSIIEPDSLHWIGLASSARVKPLSFQHLTVLPNTWVFVSHCAIPSMLTIVFVNTFRTFYAFAMRLSRCCGSLHHHSSSMLPSCLPDEPT